MSTKEQIEALPPVPGDNDVVDDPSEMAFTNLAASASLEQSSKNAHLKEEEDVQGLALMNIVLQQMVDSFKKNPSEAETDASAYIEALEKAPKLIAQESDPLMFLRREGGDAKAASHRLIKYWKIRLNVFGPDLAFRSLMNGDALTSDARENIFEKSDTLVLLPNDEQGRTVVCKNCMLRRPGTMSPPPEDQDKVKASRMQSSLFVLSMAALNPKTQTEGLVLLLNLSSKATLAMPYMREFTKIVAEALPVKVHSRHIACVPPPGGRRLYTQNIIPRVDQAFSSELVAAMRKSTVEQPPVGATYHIGDSPSDLGNKLELYGFERQGLPKCFGGTWEHKQFVDLLEKQLARNQDEQQKKNKEGVGIKLPKSSELEERISSSNKDELSTKTDYLGTSSPSQESPETAAGKPSVSSRLDAMHDCVKRLVDDFKKDPENAKVNAAAYIEALERAPQLITEESDPLLFLRREDGNIAAASRRLLLYWSYRRQLLGAEKAYKSIIRWEAMDEDFREGLSTDMACILPNDSYGRCVGAIDFARRVYHDDNEFAHKALHFLYFFMLVACNPKSQSEGFVMLFILANNTSLQLPHFRKFAMIIHEALPVKMYSRHICCCPPLGARDIFMEYMIPSVDRATGRDILPDAIIHVEDSLPELVQRLEAHGLLKEDLPITVGGSWDHDKYMTYIDDQLSRVAEQDSTRLLKEKGRQIEKTGKEWKDLVKLPAETKAVEQQVSVAGLEKANGQHSACPEKQPAKKRHILMSKLKLQPCGIPLADQYESSIVQETLKKLDAAMKVNPAEIFDRGSSEKERIAFNRKRNALYSKRKYYRKKLKVESLMSSKERLATENLTLKLENRRLESLYEKARQEVLSIETQNVSRTSVSFGGTVMGDFPLNTSQFPCQQFSSVTNPAELSGQPPQDSKNFVVPQGLPSRAMPGTSSFLPTQIASLQQMPLAILPQSGFTTDWMQSQPLQQQQQQVQMSLPFQQGMRENLQPPFALNLSGVSLSQAVQQQPDLIRQLLALQQQSQPQQQQQQQTLPSEDMLSQLMGMGNFRNHTSNLG